MDLPKSLSELHHVYAISCELDPLKDALEKCRVPRIGCPDVYIYECQEFRIDDARALRERAIMRPVELERRIFIISCAAISSEAQNALLKTIEEPRGNAVFFFLTPSPARLLPTFRSRVQLIANAPSSTNAGHPSIIDIPAFLAAAPAKRITMLEVFTKKKDGEERDLQSIGMFLDALERALAARKAGLHSVYLAKKYLHDKGGSMKHLLEQVALLI
ncbi:MAG: hypothetical protein HYT30_00050 [Parcubacteria group bacterium]|nr:hypothetical protein [Parcubacteria group bacterium]